MKKLSLILALVVLCANSYSQEVLSKEEVNSLPENQKILFKQLQQESNSSKARIAKYLVLNKDKKQIVRTESGKTFVMYDIINNKPVYRSLDNDEAAIATKTNQLHSGGNLGLNLDGAGITVVVWDGGPIETTHTEFQNAAGTLTRITNVENETTDGSVVFDDHAMHVTGTISARGTSARAKGMAPAVSVMTYNFNDDALEMISVLNDPSVDMFLSNHSYGVPIEQPDGNLDAYLMGSYNASARGIDNILRENPNYLMVTSAGNSGETVYDGGLFSGFDKLTSNTTAKNNLVVANANPEFNPFTNDITSIIINPGSSQGPTDDLRIKPDIAGDGTALFSPTTGDGYSVFSGTSMSSPNVTGSLVLLQQYYNQINGNYMKASTLKGLACHTTVDDDTNAGPDPFFGWGLLNAAAAAEAITAANSGGAIIDELTLNDSETYSISFNAQSGQKLSATICWTDISGDVTANSESPNDPIPALVNDLDLRITKDGTTFLPWKLDYSPSLGFTNSTGDNFVDNVERIDIEAPENLA